MKRKNANTEAMAVKENEDQRMAKIMDLAKRLYEEDCADGAQQFEDGTVIPGWDEAPSIVRVTWLRIAATRLGQPVPQSAVAEALADREVAA